MVKIFVGEPDRLCVICEPHITKMIKLPYLEDVYQCPTCFGFEYISPDYRVEDENAEEFGE